MNEIPPGEKMKVSFEQEHDMVYVDLRRLDLPQDVHYMWNEINREVEKSKKRLIMVDITRSEQKTISNACRKAFQEHTDEYNSFRRVSYIVTSPVIRMLLKATITTVDKNKIGKIFKTGEEGLKWLEDES